MSVQLHYKVILLVYHELPSNVPSVYVLLIRSQLEPRTGKRNTREIACALNCVEAKTRFEEWRARRAAQRPEGLYTPSS